MQENFEKAEENISVLCCKLDKIITLSKVLNQTLFENNDFKTADSQNLCSLLIQETEASKHMADELEKLFSLLKISCR